MLLLLFSLGAQTYTIRCDRVREIVPMVDMKKAGNAPDFFAGMFNYRGTIVPVLDLRRLIQGVPCEMRLSTRIILIDYPTKEGTPFLLGLMAERVTEAVRRPDKDLLRTGVHLEKAPYLGNVVMEEKQMIQVIDLDRLPAEFLFLPERADGTGDPRTP